MGNARPYDPVGLTAEERKAPDHGVIARPLLGPWQSPVSCDARRFPINMVHLGISMLSEMADRTPISEEIATACGLAMTRGLDGPVR